MGHLDIIYNAVLDGDAQTVQSETEIALEAGIPAESILEKACIPAMDEVGRLFEIGENFVPEMLIAARAMQAGMALLRPGLAEADVKPKGRIAIGTVKGDLHDIGKNLVAMMMEGAGFKVIDLGVDVPPEKFVETAQNEKVDLLALSALLTTTMPGMIATLEALEAAGIRDQVKVIVGGAPVTNDYAKQIGADGYSPDASQAVRVVNTLLGI